MVDTESDALRRAGVGAGVGAGEARTNVAEDLARAAGGRFSAAAAFGGGRGGEERRRASHRDAEGVRT